MEREAVSGEVQNGRTRRYFILLSTARSGSTLLMDLMNNHPELKCLHEPLNRERLLEKHLKGAHKDKILNYLKTEVMAVDRPVVGMKLFLEHLVDTGLSLSDITGVLDKPKIIVLYRPSLLDTFVSLQIAYLNNQWYSTREKNEVTIDLNWANFLGYSTEWRQLWESVITEVKQLTKENHRIIVSYDKLCESKDDVTQSMFRFLDVWEIDYGIHHYSVKQNPEHLREKLSNYDEISELISSNIELTMLSL